jgi:PAS domain S-box-containing protein
MSTTRILVVEDESIVAKDIQNTLIRLGYEVPATASSAATAYEKLEQLEPDLVFLDIKLKGDQDGIHIAEYIKEKFNIPVIFLTSFVDQATLDRAKVTEPYGYLVKPFNESDLKTTVEMALFKFSKDREMRDREQRLVNALSKVDEVIIIIDEHANITYLNEKAEMFLGFGNNSALGIDIYQMIGIEQEGGNSVKKDFLMEKMRNNENIEFEDCFILMKRDNSSVAAAFSASPVHDEKNLFLGAAIVIADKSNSTIVSDNQVQTVILDNQVINNSFFVKKGSMLVKVYLDNIQWIQAMDNYVIIQTTSDQFVIHSTMKDIEIKLPSTRFLRVHRSYIIPIEKINVLDENTVLIGDKTIPIGKSYKEAFMARLNFL